MLPAQRSASAAGLMISPAAVGCKPDVGRLVTAPPRVGSASPFRSGQPRSSVDRLNLSAVPCRRLPVRDDSVIAAAWALPCDPFIGPPAILDDTGAGATSWAPAALDPVYSLILIIRGGSCRCHDPRHMLHQPACGTRNICRQLARLVDEVTQVRDPGHTHLPCDSTAPAAWASSSCLFVFSCFPCCPPNDRASAAAACGFLRPPSGRRRLQTLRQLARLSALHTQVRSKRLIH